MFTNTVPFICVTCYLELEQLVLSSQMLVRCLMEEFEMSCGGDASPHMEEVC